MHYIFNILFTNNVNYCLLKCRTRVQHLTGNVACPRCRTIDAEKGICLWYLGNLGRDDFNDHAFLLETIDAPKGSAIYKAVFYSTNQKNSLIMYPLDSRIELTNNLAERVIKTFVLGRKNWLFSDTDKGNDRNAKCYSIIESAKVNNINVFEFLTPILTELSKFENKPTNEQIEQFFAMTEIIVGLLPN